MGAEGCLLLFNRQCGFFLTYPAGFVCVLNVCGGEEVYHTVVCRPPWNRQSSFCFLPSSYCYSVFFLHRVWLFWATKESSQPLPFFGVFQTHLACGGEGFTIDSSIHSDICQYLRFFDAVTVPIIATVHQRSNPAVRTLIRTSTSVHSSLLNKMKSIRFTLLRLLAVLSVGFRIRQMSLRLRSARHAEHSGNFFTAW